ncbi:MAG: NIL domain-containing protein [Planctomycetota bacterium]
MAARETRKSLRYKMTFPQKIVGEPIMTKLAQDFNVTYNMMRGRISEKGAWLDVELTGAARNIDKALKYLAERGVTIQPLEG